MNYNIKIGAEQFELSDAAVQNLDLIPTGNGTYHLLHNNQSYKVKLLNINSADKSVSLDINGVIHDLAIEDEYDALVEKMGLSTIGTQKMNNVKAPMPGLILDILVKPGDEVVKGDQLLILEAMKMENVLKAEGEGVVKSIEVSKTDAVEKGQILIEME